MTECYHDMTVYGPNGSYLPVAHPPYGQRNLHLEYISALRLKKSGEDFSIPTKVDNVLGELVLSPFSDCDQVAPPPELVVPLQDLPSVLDTTTIPVVQPTDFLASVFAIMDPKYHPLPVPCVYGSVYAVDDRNASHFSVPAKAPNFSVQKSEALLDKSTTFAKKEVEFSTPVPDYYRNPDYDPDKLLYIKRQFKLAPPRRSARKKSTTGSSTPTRTPPQRLRPTRPVVFGFAADDAELLPELLDPDDPPTKYRHRNERNHAAVA